MILIAGIGNIFLGDDAFGTEVARRIARHITLPGVHVADFGIRGLDLAFALIDGYEATIIVDATPRGGPPGTIYVIDPDLDEPRPDATPLDAHSMNPMHVLALARSMGAKLDNIRIVGCEPETFGSVDEGYIGLSPAVEAAVDRAIGVIQSLIHESKPANASYCGGGL